MNLKQILTLISAYSTLIQNKKRSYYNALHFLTTCFAKYLKIVVMNFTVDLIMYQRLRVLCLYINETFPFLYGSC